MMTDKFHNPNSVPTNFTVQPSDSDKSPGFFVILSKLNKKVPFFECKKHCCPPMFTMRALKNRVSQQIGETSVHTEYSSQNVNS